MALRTLFTGVVLQLAVSVSGAALPWQDHSSSAANLTSEFLSEDSLLTKRALSYEDAVAKGCRNKQMMESRTAKPSLFNAVPDLFDNGYDHGVRDNWNKAQTNDLYRVFQAIGISDADADNHYYTAIQQRAGTTFFEYGDVNGEKGEDGKVKNYFPALTPFNNMNAGYSFFFNARSRSIAAISSFQPRGDGQPPLTKHSDVTYLSWLHYNDGNIVAPNWFFRHHITTRDTVGVIRSVFDKISQTPSVWPGVSFDTSSEEGQALLGTAHGSGVSFFLAQHFQDEPLTVTRIYLFLPNRFEMQFSMAFEINPL